MSKLDQSNAIAKVTTPLGDNVLVIRSFNIQETLGRLPIFELDMLSENKKIDPKSLLGKPVGVQLNIKGGKKRHFRGHVIQFGRGADEDRYFPYRATVVPWLWYLTRRSNCRIFQKKTAPEIIAEVFGEYGFDYKPRLSADHSKWEYCVQYRETDYNFVTRLMEQEGISFFFQYEEEKDVLILADSPSSYEPFPGYKEITYRPPGGYGSDADREHIREFVLQMNHLSGAYVHKDYDFESPNTDLTAQSKIPGEYGNSKFEVFDYPGEYTIHSDGQEWARTRMEEIHAQTEAACGWGDTCGLAAGSVFTFKEPNHPDHAGDYLATSVRHSFRTNEYESGRAGDGPVYTCHFQAQPSKRVFRPERTTPKPRVNGIQTAVVTGPPGEEIYTDKYGRIKVQFHWDREGKKNENSSCWVRVAQIWAGRRWGAMFTPRIGQEVVVDFLEGDPDQPLVIGSLYNGDQKPAYLFDGPDPKHANDPNVSGIKSNSTKGGGGYNEIRFDDTKGKEQVFIHAERDMDVRIKSNARTTVGGGIDFRVGDGGEGSITGKIEDSLLLWVLQSIGIGVDDQYYMEVGESGDVREVRTASGKHLLQSSNAFSYKAGGSIVLDAPDICLTAGSNFIRLTPAGIFINGTMVYVNSGGTSASAEEVPLFRPKEPDAADHSKSGFPSCNQ